MVVTGLAAQPRLPPGERLTLPGRGTTFVRSLPGPPGAPTVLLLHGWIASGGLNWLTAFGPLSKRYRVIAPDMRGHARGLRSRRRFRLADCADDMAALLELVDATPAIVVGYSMGGPIAQLLWRRHEASVAGLVLCATADRFVTGARERFLFTSMMATAANTTRVGALVSRVPLASARRLAPVGARARPTSLRTWAAGGDAPPRCGEDHGGGPGHRHLQRAPLDRRDRRADHGDGDGARPGDRTGGPARDGEPDPRLAGPAHRRRPHGLRTTRVRSRPRPGRRLRRRPASHAGPVAGPRPAERSRAR